MPSTASTHGAVLTPEFTWLPPERDLRDRAKAVGAAAARTYSATARLLLGAAMGLVVFTAGGALMFLLGVGALSAWNPGAVGVAMVAGAIPVLFTAHYRRTLREAASLPQRAWQSGRAVAGPVLVTELRRSAVTAAVSRSRSPLHVGRIVRRSASGVRAFVPGAGTLASVPYHLAALVCLPVAGWMWVLGLTATLAAVTL